MFKFRPCQKKAMEDIMDFVLNQSGRNGLVVAPCAFGKSLVIGSLANNLNERVVCIQPNKELLKQNYDKYLSYGEEASIFSASLGSKEIGHVTFATPRSVYNHMDEFHKAGVDYMIIDEAHLQTKIGQQTHQLVKKFKPKKVIGLTATPVYLTNTMQGAMLRMMNRARDSFFRKIIHTTQIDEMVSGGYWSPLIYDNRYVDTSMLKFNSTGSDYTEASIMKMYEDNNTHSHILEEVDHLQTEGRKSILVFVPTIAEADMLAAEVPGAASVSADTPTKERERITEGFKSGEISVLFNVMIAAVGFDHPELDAIVHARPTNSIAVYYQSFGRGVRIAPGKQDCKIVDLSGNSFKFGKLEHIQFLEIPNFGWGMFGEGGKLLTGVPMGSEAAPTFDEIISKSKPAPDRDTAVARDEFYFGKHSGKTFQQVWNEDKNYMEWFTSYKFEPFNDKVRELKTKAINFVKQKLIKT